MGRALQIAAGLGLAGLLLVWGYGLLGNPHPGRLADRAGSRPAAPVPVAPSAAGVAGSPESPAVAAPSGGEGKIPGPTPGVAIREREGQPPRLPVQVANLARYQNLEKVIEKYARQYGVNQELVWAVIRQESGFNPRAVSPKGARGLMQLMPETAALMGVTDAFDVEQNVAGGIKYLERCLSRFNQDVGLALAAYNAGPDNVVKYQGCPPFPETRQYVASILRAYAGETSREDVKLMGLGPARDGEGPEPGGAGGLAWRVPRAHWKIATPRCTLGSPRWKVSLLPF
jgi:hypothetical protein